MTTYRDVQALTGLSLSTISKYFNGLPVREKNRQAIEAVVKQLDFHPNALARGLRSRRSQSVGVLLPALDNDFHLRIIAGVERTLRVAGISTLIRSSDWGEGGAEDSDNAVESLTNKMVDGLLAVPEMGDNVPLRQVRNIPLVLIDRLIDGLATDAVVLDNEAAGAQAARLLVDHGHRRIAVIGGDERVWTMPRRLAGFRSVLLDRGVELCEGQVSDNPLTVEGGREAMHRVLTLRDRPTAVFAVNYELTLGALIAVAESGLRIPEDVSFIGFDAADLARLFRPPLTYISQPVEQIAEAAAQVMLTRLQGSGGDQPTVRKLSGHLVVGGSVARVG